jgi:hypothetical protein
VGLGTDGLLLHGVSAFRRLLGEGRGDVVTRVTVENHPTPAAPDAGRWAAFDMATLRRASDWYPTEAAARRIADGHGWEVVTGLLFPIGDASGLRPVVDERGGAQLSLGLRETS